MKRSRSPISDNTIANCVYEDSDESDDLFEESGSTSDIVDDSDADPHWDPDQPSTSGINLLRNITNVPTRPHLFSSSESDGDSDNGLNSTTPRPRGRPIRQNVPVPNPNSSDSDDDVQWSNVIEDNDPGCIPNFSFQEIPGVKHCPPRNSNATSYFKLFFTLSLLQRIVKYTNLYAQNVIAAKIQRNPNSPNSKPWVKVTVDEIQAFIAVLINMGVTRKPTIASYWWTNPNHGTPWFGKQFTRNRFQDILSYFHLVDTSNLPKPKEPNYDPCSRFQPLIDQMNTVSRHHFTPGKYLSIDESIVPTKSHNPMMQYIPSKRHRFGVKLWMICDAVTHYCLGFLVYKGAKDSDRQQIRENGLGYTVVMKLLELGNYLNKGYHVCVDNFFTSIKLAKELYAKCTFITGTIRHNRQGIPDGLKVHYDVGEKKYYRQNNILMLGYRQRQSKKKPVLLLSTNAKAESEARSKKRGNKISITSKPKMIREYNDFMGGIDGNDQMLYHYLNERKTIKFWKKLTFNIISRMVLNSYTLYKNNTDNPVCRLQYISNLVDELTVEWADVRGVGLGTPQNQVNNANNGGAKTFFEKIPDGKEKNCCVCSAESTKSGGKRKKSTFMCVNCKKGLHTKCYPLHRCL